MLSRRSNDKNQKPSTNISVLARSDYGNFFTKSVTHDFTKVVTTTTQADDGIVTRDDLYKGCNITKQTNVYQSMQNYANQNRIEKQLNNALQKPVDMGPGHSMLQRMGWTGGGLGRTGDGILEPIAPNATYATKTKGLGQSNAPKVRQRSAPNSRPKDKFRTNVLLTILDFVKNDKKIQLEFDKKVQQSERKIIHTMVQEMINSDHLVSESHGVRPERKLVIYKEAPENMYLIIPDDLVDTAQSQIYEDSKDQKQTESTKNNNSIKEENNKEKTNQNTNEKQKDLTQDDILNTIIDFFIDFASADVFTELRFLGTFNKTEYDAIVSFFKLFGSDEKSEAKDKMADVLNDEKYEYKLRDNFNGSTVVYKLIKDGKS
ncbi:uncharacterized protein LOC123704030 isoform X2 [Colias croceus]|uniref:uncharacterized protein LOC123704030 isoform X2 n=1 Tax=Colias crocea TaxID=72248 RepID=UPI001E27C701|nr:uncharacterized protein LOC123704030 isoform X2 [Colias croceus]